MKSEIKSSDGLFREIEVEIPAETVDAAFAEKYKEYGKKAKIKGFRPGKVPLNVLKTKFADAVRQELVQDLISESYPKAVKEQDLKVISMPNISDFDLKEGSPFTYTARVEVMPEIDRIDYDGLQLPREEIEVRDSEVDAVVQHLRRKAADIRTVDRAAGEDDILFGDLIKIDDPENVLETEKVEGIEIDLSSPVTLKEFKEALKGIKAGEEREIRIEYPEDFSNERLAGKNLTYLCKTKEVKEKVLPPENDDFARAQAKVETMLELRLKIRENLKLQKEHDQKRWERQQIIHQIVTKNQIPIPEAMVTDYIDAVVEDMKKKEEPFDEEKAREHYRPIAVDNIRWNLLLSRLAETEKIEVLPSDTENWIRAFAEGNNLEYEKAKEMLSGAGKIREIRDSILEDKVLGFLFPKVEYVEGMPDVKITAEPESEKAEEKEKKDDIITEEK